MHTPSRRLGAVLAAVLLALGGLAAVTPNAAAAVTGPWSIDGTIADPGTTALADPTGNVKELGPANGNPTKIGVIHSAPVPMLDLTNPNNQVDLSGAWLGTGKTSPAADTWLYFAWQRESNTGSGYIAYEFMQAKAPAACAYDTATDAQLIASCNPWANRKAGDFLIVWDQQGSDIKLWLRTWSGTAPNLTLGAPVAIPNQYGAAALSADNKRGEAAVNLTQVVFGGQQLCRMFANTIPSTVTGNSDSADYKDTILKQAPPITNCTSTTVTTPKTGAGADIPSGGLSIGTDVVAVKDSAVVDLVGGTATPTGSVAFSLCKVDAPGLCATGGTSVGSVDLTGTAYPVTLTSGTAYVTAAGRYCWRAEFSGDAANGIPASTDATASECFVVNPVTPTLSTTAGADVLVGQPVTDTATLGGTANQPTSPAINLTGATGAKAGGTLTFKLYGPGDTACGPLVYTSSPVTVSGNADYTAQYTPTAAGTYHWVAAYSGSSPNTSSVTHNDLCTDTNEDVVVKTVPSSLTSAQTWVPNDSVTVTATAGGNLAGTVSFGLYAGATCTGTALYTVDKTVAGASPQTVGTANTSAVPAGSYSWKVSYDSTNGAQRDIGASCHETSTLTVSNGGTVTSP